MQGTDVLHDSFLKSFSKIQWTQAFFKKTKFLAWGSKACSLFDQNRAAPCYMACRDFAYQSIKTQLFHHFSHSILPTFLYQNFPKLPFTNFSHLHLLFHFLNIIHPQSYHQFINPNHHQTTIIPNFPQTSQNFPFTIFLNHKWPPTKETPAQRKPPTPNHPQTNPNALVCIFSNNQS